MLWFFSTAVAPLTAAILGDLTSENAGITSAVNNAAARIVGLISVAFVGVITGSHINIQGFHNVLIAAACLMEFGEVVSYLRVYNRHG